MIMAKSKTRSASDIEYDLITTMHKLLEGSYALEEYLGDAHSDGEKEIVACFQKIHDNYQASVTELRSLLTKQLTQN